MNPGILVTGTDTGVGKTAVACGVLATLHAQGIPLQPFKPVESGHDGTNEWPSDGAALHAASGLNLPREAVVPIVYQEPLAPNVAARRSNHSIDLNLLDNAFREATKRGPVLVEGAGGITVHLTDTFTVADLARRWNLPILIVARAGLGTLNHTLLTILHAHNMGLEVVGVILNGAPTNPDIATATNQDEMTRILAPHGVPVLGTIPHMESVDVAAGAWHDMAKATATHINLAPILARLTP